MFPARDFMLRLAPELVLCVAGHAAHAGRAFSSPPRGGGVLVTMATVGAGLAFAQYPVLPTRGPAAFSPGLLRVDGFSVFFT